MVISLIKKDILLVKSNFKLMILFALIVPFIIGPKIGSSLGQLSGLIVLFYEVFFAQLFLYNSIATVEGKYNRGQALLCSTPYRRRTIVLGKYLINLFLFLFCVLVYSIATIFLSQHIGKFSMSIVASVFLFSVILSGVQIPLEFKFGHDKIKYIFSVFIIASPYILPLIVKYVFDKGINIFPTTAAALIMIAIGLIFSAISYFISLGIYVKKDI